jgi:hypothetical protein
MNSSTGHPMRRLALFTVALLILVGIGSRPWHGSSSRHSMCVCLPSRAALMLKSMTTSVSAKKQAPSGEQSTTRAAAPSPKLASRT